ncbi:MAG TPA: protein kinase [Terriglobales bacterium]|nr:protein kinase [Terriglobales bacterium]
MAVGIGTRLGPYEILAPIGAGGMGEVYRARDTRLARDVAIKILPAAFAQDAERLARFEREAQLLAALNHPHIAVLHGLEDVDGQRFLVMELVEGETLGLRGRIAVRDALELARQIAEALEAAHGKGIIHRDLKPANIRVTLEGQVKVLDFGLARGDAAVKTSSDSDSPTATFRTALGGAMMGTAAYMSPEQARGQAVDKRTDIWSFGCVLYEMLSGQRAFRGETTTDSIVAILEREPDWDALPAPTPAGIRRLLKRCLVKDRKQRLHDIADARLEIEEAMAQPQGEPAVAEQPGRSRLYVLAAVCLVVGALAAWAVLWKRGAQTQTTRLVQVSRLTHDPAHSEWPTWSPDGKLVAYSANRGGNFDIYVRRIEGGQDVNVTNDPGEDIQPAFSPDGQWIAFISTRSSRTGMVRIGSTFGMEFRTLGGDLWVAPALGGPARRLAADANAPAWNPDGKHIAYISGSEYHRSILEVSTEDGKVRTIVAELDSLRTANAPSPTWEITRVHYSPDGKWITFGTVDPEQVMIQAASGGTARKLLDASTHEWGPLGRRIYFLRRDERGGTELGMLPMDAASGEAGGEPQSVGMLTGVLTDLTLARDGQQIAVSELEGSMNLTRLPLDAGGAKPAGAEEELSEGRVIDRYPSYSPDGRYIAYASDRLGGQDIWLLDVEKRERHRLSLPGSDRGASTPYWSPDGKKLALARVTPDGRRSVWLVAVDGSGAEELIPPAEGLGHGQFSPDGSRLLFGQRVGGNLELFLLDMKTRKQEQLTSSPGNKWPGEGFSPDGKWIVYFSNAGGSIQAWRIPAEGGREEQLTFGHDRVRHAFYSPDGEWLYVQPNHGNILRIPAAGGKPQAVTHFPESGLFIEEPTLSPDGRYIVYCRSNGASSLWLLRLEGTE